MYELFEKLLINRGVKVSDVTKATGISASSFSDWKAGRYTPKQDKLQKIADYFGVSLEYLSSGQESNRTITDDEYMIILHYRSAEDYIKKAILNLLGIEINAIREKDALGA